MEPLADITVTAADRDWLAALTRKLVEQRLVACGNIIPDVRSIYRWNGAIEDDHEALVILHTRRSLIDAVTARIQSEHPYDEPQILALPVLTASPGYHAWVLDSTDESRAQQAALPD